MTADDAGLAPVGYRVVLPPGWVRIPLREGTERAVDAVLERSFAELPRDSTADVRSEVRSQLLAQAHRARDDGQGLDLLLPVELSHGQTIAASAIVAEFAFDGVSVDPGHVLTALIADAQSTTPIALDGASGVRAERVVVADPSRQQGLDSSSRRVDYVLAVPNDPGRWVTISFSSFGDGKPDSDFSALLVELFDAIMGTWRWKRT